MNRGAVALREVVHWAVHCSIYSISATVTSACCIDKLIVFKDVHCKRLSTKSFLMGANLKSKRCFVELTERRRPILSEWNGVYGDSLSITAREVSLLMDG
jgi:hypothetical protein